MNVELRAGPYVPGASFKIQNSKFNISSMASDMDEYLPFTLRSFCFIIEIKISLTKGNPY
jgi:hypothetical protein